MRRRRRSGGRRIVWGLVALVVAFIGAGAGFALYVLLASRATLDGETRLAALAAPVTITRDAAGVPTLTATTRPDLARALGFLHAQERFFQMDLLRRAGAGELSALVGPVALSADRTRRIHRFRARAAAVLAAMPPTDLALLEAYTSGVNAGLAALGHAPWEYTVLRAAPLPWTAVDTILVVDAMYFDLQDADPDGQLQNAAAIAQLGAEMAAFLYPNGVPDDAPLDGSHLTEPPIPAHRADAKEAGRVTAPPPTPGSNNFAVAGRLSLTGAAIVENDMHLALRVPNIWFRARMVMPGALDIVGVTLPGVPFVVVGSNTHIAWAFTDSYIESGDAVALDMLPGADTYRTPDGPRRIQVSHEEICAAHAACEDLTVRETVWGPIMRQDPQGRPIVWRWMAHDDTAVGIAGFEGLERATTVRQALDAAHMARLPDQNFVVGDAAGHVAWTVIGQVPRRVGLNDQLPQSWADGAHGWRGYLAPADIPEVIDPQDGRLWSANARVLGGAAYETLGNGGYAGPSRARAIHDDLFARDSFDEAALLAIATDTRAHMLDPWQALLLHAIDAHVGGGALAALRPYVSAWGGRAEPASIGYRLVRDFRTQAIKRIYAGLAAPMTAPGGEVLTGRNADWPSLRLLATQPPALVPPPFHDWAGLIDAAADAVASGAGTDLAHYTWGARNHTGIGHPLARAVPGLAWLTDPPDVAIPGDIFVPRVSVPGFGASERMIVSPGHEDRALFDMPAGQAGNPLSPYYGAGEQAWGGWRGHAPSAGAAEMDPEARPAIDTDFECVVAGAGVVGIAIARALALRGLRVLLLEALAAHGTVTSARNSGVIHAGLYYNPGSLRARLCVAGRHALYAFCAERGVDARACGKLVVANGAAEEEALHALAQRAAANGVEDLALLSAAQAREMEPELRCSAALWSPVTGIVDVHALMLALLAEAEAHGAVLATRARLVHAAAAAGGFALRTEDGTTLTTRLLVNAAGHGACALARCIEGLDPALVPQERLSKGSYFSLSGRCPFTRLIYPMPIPGGAGVHLTLDLGGQARFGPDVEAVEDFNYGVDPAREDVFTTAIRRYWPGLADGALQPGYAGIRPKIVPADQVQDFVIQGPAAHGLRGLVNLFGIESPGLTAALAIGDGVLSRLHQA